MQEATSEIDNGEDVDIRIYCNRAANKEKNKLNIRCNEYNR